jgi:hypothetical protein
MGLQKMPPPISYSFTRRATALDFASARSGKIVPRNNFKITEEQQIVKKFAIEDPDHCEVKVSVILYPDSITHAKYIEKHFKERLKYKEKFLSRFYNLKTNKVFDDKIIRHHSEILELKNNLNINKDNLWNKLSINNIDATPNISPPNKPQCKNRDGNIVPLQTPDNNGVEAKRSYFDLDELTDNVASQLINYLTERGEEIIMQEAPASIESQSTPIRSKITNCFSLLKQRIRSKFHHDQIQIDRPPIMRRIAHWCANHIPVWLGSLFSRR